MPTMQTTMKKSHTLNSSRHMSGFSLIEMMLSMLIGSIILAGIFTIFANTRESQRTMDQHLTMVGDARFSVELLTYDLRHASIYGGTNMATLVQCRDEDSGCSATAPANDCIAGWSHDLDLPVYSPLTDAEVDAYNCPINGHVAGTDVIVVRSADTNSVDDADLAANTTYVRSNYRSGMIFVGDTLPVFSGDTGDEFTRSYQLTTRAYYISSYTDTVGDGIPSLRRIELQAGSTGPELVDQVLMSGVEDLQIQFGVDTTGDGEIDKYVDSSSVSAQSVTDTDDDNRAIAKKDWLGIKAVKIWTMVKAEKQEEDFNTASASGTGYELGGFTRPDSDLNDGYRRLLLSNVIRMRNMEYDAVVATATQTASP